MKICDWRIPMSLAGVVVGSVALSQNALSPFGITEMAARNYLLAELRNSGRPTQISPLVAVVRKGYDRMPHSARGPTTTALFAWAKAYVSSAAFTTAYASVRAEKKPQGAPSALTVDEEVKKTINNQIAEMEQGKQIIASLPPDEKATALSSLKEAQDNLRKPESIKAMREGIEAMRAARSAGDTKSMADWEATYPADPQMFVKRCLEQFMTSTANVDLAELTIVIKGTNGETIGFLRPGYNGLPWENIHATLAGEDVLAAGRAAAAVWLKELGGK